MRGWIIFGAIVLVIVLLLLLRVGVNAEFGDVVTVLLKVGPFKIQLVPSKKEKTPKKKPKKAEEDKKKPKAETDGEKKPKKKLKLTFEDIRTGIEAAFTALYRVLRKTRQRIRIAPLDLSLTFAGDDPAKVAEIYGWANTAMWTMMPQLEKVIRIPNPHIHLDVDYQADKLCVRGRAGADFRVGDFFAIAFAAVGPLLRWLNGYLKRQKAAKQAEEAKEKQTREETKQTA